MIENEDNYEKIKTIINEYESALRKSNENIQNLKNRICELIEENKQLKSDKEKLTEKLRKAKEDIKCELSEKIELLREIEKTAKNLNYVNNEIIWKNAFLLLISNLPIEANDICESIQNMNSQSESQKQVNIITQNILIRMNEYFEKINSKIESEVKLRRKAIHRYMSLRGNFRIMLRMRPLIANEISSYTKKYIKDTFSFFANKLTITTNAKSESYDFDYIFDQNANQRDVYGEVSMLINNIYRAKNITIIAYGQTNSGKSYTIEGEGNNTNEGIVQQSIEEMFEIANSNKDKKINISLSIVEIYNDTIYNLLDANTNIVEIYEDNKENNVTLTGLRPVNVSKVEEAKDLINLARKMRITRENTYNESSSRSHCIYSIYFQYLEGKDYKCGKVNFVDLAGSERLSRREVLDTTLKKESQYINLSLNSLSNVLTAISSKKSHVPYRDNKLTHYLKDSLTSSYNILLILQISPLRDDICETFCTLDLGKRFCECCGASRRTRSFDYANIK